METKDQIEQLVQRIKQACLKNKVNCSLELKIRFSPPEGLELLRGELPVHGNSYSLNASIDAIQDESPCDGVAAALMTAINVTESLKTA